MRTLVERNSVVPPTECPAWKALKAHFQELRKLHLRDLFAEDPNRGQRLTAEAAGIYLDYSKNRVTNETLKLLVQLADESGLRPRIDAMFRGDKINITEESSGATRSSPCSARRHPFWSMGKTSCLKFTQYSTK